MKKINVVTYNDGYGLQLFDKLYAYRQSLNKDFAPDIDISFSQSVKKNSFNIFFDYMPQTAVDAKKYDLVILDNSDEPLGGVCTYSMLDAIQNENVYVQANSVFHKDKNFESEKIIPLFGDIENVKDFYTRPFYPQYYQPVEYNKIKKICYINGNNRADRHHFVTLLEKNTNIPCTNNLAGMIHETNDSLIESESDKQFREFVNTTYQINRNAKHEYYSKIVSCGIGEKFGKILPGYFLMQEYQEYSVIAFHVSSWINDELSISEKDIKCFIARCLPFPIGGRNTNVLYNQIGFKTAWNLLPDYLKGFDQEPDHCIRAEAIMQALTWLDDNIPVLSEEINKLTEHNKNLYFNNKFAKIGVEKFNRILKDYEC